MEIDSSHVSRTYSFKQFLLPGYIFLFFCIWIWTFVEAYDLYVWIMENILLFLMVVGAVFTYKKYPFSHLSYSLLITFLLLHLYGARYTYENNPLGLWFQSIAGTERNSYDRVVHFSFGALWTYPVYELIRKYGKIPLVFASIGTFTILTTLASLYELVEWIVGEVFFPEQGTAFIGLQGDVWDTQKDIALALVGSLFTLALILFARKPTISASNA
ncbi:DUF2238 domain-containing protein [Rhodocytophaga aerolata]|uniref:DUF2238 domain-containing protein n=1 Tax=Rhodocytophaga aerolata TaxID=455078 RepID=A0ABT8R9Z1_9BACT|nr:DUF2238 domain-containing protein [Rhodocytophaga aerolata]MDO1448919.1 DUF2238 domain-containing protein [Rhodocytophaga aerolata]